MGRVFSSQTKIAGRAANVHGDGFYWAGFFAGSNPCFVKNSRATSFGWRFSLSTAYMGIGPFQWFDEAHHERSYWYTASLRSNGIGLCNGSSCSTAALCSKRLTDLRRWGTLVFRRFPKPRNEPDHLCCRVEFAGMNINRMLFRSTLQSRRQE
jgi:hypothetical protein